MSRLLIRDALLVATMDDAGTRIPGGDVLIDGNRIAAVGRGLPTDGVERVIDARGRLVLPGMVNTHHHLYQTLTRAIPRVQDVELFAWLCDLYEVWRELTPEAVRVSALVGLGELLLTGCTTSADHFYLFPRKAPADLLDGEIAAARELGIRFHPCRGSMSRGRSQGGLPPDDCVQTPDEILADSERVIRLYHDPKPLSMCRLALAPCSPFSVTEELLRDTAALARRAGVRLHTHLCETMDEETYCLKTYGRKPIEFIEESGWLGDDAWFAHMVHVGDGEIRKVAEAGSGIAHCPTSNLRLGSGIAPVPRMLELGARVGLGVDGSASNDSSDMLGEARMALLVHRVGTGVSAMTAEKALRLATRGGATVLGRDDIGSIELGKAADLAIFDLRGIDYAGSLHDPLAAIVFAGASHRAETVIVNGEIVVKEGRLARIDEMRVAEEANRTSRGMTEAAEERTGTKYLVPRR